MTWNWGEEGSETEIDASKVQSRAVVFSRHASCANSSCQRYNLIACRERRCLRKETTPYQDLTRKGSRRAPKGGEGPEMRCNCAYLRDRFYHASRHPSKVSSGYKRCMGEVIGWGYGRRKSRCSDLLKSAYISINTGFAAAILLCEHVVVHGYNHLTRQN